MNVYLQSLGCRLNQSELDSLACRFVSAGHVVVSDPVLADVCLVNTCAVTAEAERKSRHRTRALARANPQARIAVLGCYATLSPKRCASLPGVAWVVSNDEKGQALDIVARAALVSCREKKENPASLAASVSEALRGDSAEPSPRGRGLERMRFPISEQNPHFRTRAFVKVQDGCDNHCTYCIVRSLRGPGRSRPVAEVVAQMQSLVEDGCQEAVLTGVNLGAYGRDLGLLNGLAALVVALLAHTDLPRLRLSSLEPWDLDETFFELWENPRLCRQLHLPLQAGCDETLHRMGRRITATEFAGLVRGARAAVTDLAVTTDVIVGFPGEDETAFRTSCDFVAATEFARLHVFPYSPRPGTPAARLPNQVQRETRDARARAMRELGDGQALRFRQLFVGREMAVLWEQRQRDGLWTGLTDNYLRVAARAECDLHNRITATQLLAAQDGYLVGEVVSLMNRGR